MISLLFQAILRSTMKKLIILAIPFLFWNCNPQSTTESSNQIISISEGTNIAAALSPDGEEIVFDALGRLWIMPAKGGKAKAITDPYGNARQPSWSPDGKQITFQAYWEGNWHVYTVKKEGNGLQQLTEGPFDHREPFWASDGSVYYAGDRERSYDIWKVDNSGQKIRITNGSENEFAPAVSADGNLLAYVSDHPRNGGIMVRDLEAGTSGTLFQGNQEKLYAPAWGLDAQSLTFVAQGFSYSKLIRINLSDNTTQELSKVGEDVFPFRSNLAANGALIYTSNGFIQHMDQGQITSIPFEISVELNREDYTYKTRNFDSAEDLAVKGLIWPQLSPKGDEVALVMMGDVWLTDMEGNATQLTDDPFIQMYPTWSPHGEQLAFLTDQSGNFELAIHDFRTKKTEIICGTNGAVYGIDWSPDGRQIAISSSFGPRLGKVFLADVKSKAVNALTPMMPSSIGAPSWSANGQALAFGVLQPYSGLYREGVNGIWRYSIEGENLGRLGGIDHMSFGTRSKDGPVYAPDGKHIAGISAGKLWLVPIDEQGEKRGEVVQLTNELADYPSWSSDGNSILYVAIDRLKLIEIESKNVQEIPLQLKRKRNAPTNKQLIYAGKFFDSESGEVKEDIDILIEGNRIVEVQAHDEKLFNEHENSIDAGELFVMPGLIDGHAHQGSVDGEKLGRAWLSWGVTATRDPTSNPYDALNRREGQQAGVLLGPRIFFTGSSIDGTRVYYAGTSATQAKDQIELELKRADALGYDMIKTYVRLPDLLQKQVVEQAHKIGIPISSHELYPGVAYGMDGVEHILGTSRRGYSAKMSHNYLAYSDVTSLIAASRMTFTPTTGIYGAFQYLYHLNPSVLEDPRVTTFADPSFVSYARQLASVVAVNPDAWEAKIHRALKMVSDIHEKGGHISAGTDSPIYPFGFSLHIELESYSMSSMTNSEVLQSATINAAKTLHADEQIGSIKPGKLADILFLEGNPVDDIRNTRKVHSVMLNGNLYSLEELMKSNGQTQ